MVARPEKEHEYKVSVSVTVARVPKGSEYSGQTVATSAHYERSASLIGVGTCSRLAANRALRGLAANLGIDAEPEEDR